MVSPRTARSDDPEPHSAGSKTPLRQTVVSLPGSGRVGIRMERPRDITAMTAPIRKTAMRPDSSATQIRPSIQGMVTAAIWLIVNETPAVEAMSAGSAILRK